MDQAIRKHCTPPVAQYIGKMVDRAKKMICTSCGGKGHTSAQCTTKINVNKAVKVVGLRPLWGEVKSEFVAQHYERKRVVANEIRGEHVQSEASEDAMEEENDVVEVVPRLPRDFFNPQRGNGNPN